MVLYSISHLGQENILKNSCEGFKGYLTTDGYAVYSGLPDDVINAGCWAHARRKFDEAIKASGGKRKILKHSEGVGFINKLYDVERDLKRT